MARDDQPTQPDQPVRPGDNPEDDDAEHGRG